MFEFAPSLWTLNWLLPPVVVWAGLSFHPDLLPAGSLNLSGYHILTLWPTKILVNITAESVHTCHGICFTVSPSLCRGVCAGKTHQQTAASAPGRDRSGNQGSLKSSAPSSTLSLSLLFGNTTEDTSQHVCLSAVLIFHWTSRVYESIQLSHWGMWLCLFSSSPFGEVTDHLQVVDQYNPFRLQRRIQSDLIIQDS